MTHQETEQFVQEISRMNRRSLIGALRHLHCDFELDFTDEFLNSISLDRLRHIAIAATTRSHDAHIAPA